MSLEARAILVVLLIGGALCGWWRLTAHYEGVGYARAQAEYQAAAELQREANRGRAREVETAFTQKAEVRDRFIVTTVTEVRHDTQNLAACLLTPSAVQRLRDAAACASEDRPATCGAGEQVRDPGPAS